MPTTCPNCSRPVRTGATFCGFCGINLQTFSKAEPAAPELLQEKQDTKKSLKAERKAKARRKNPGRVVTIIAIILLVIVIILALVVQYWAVILPWIGQLISMLFSR